MLTSRGVARWCVLATGLILVACNRPVETAAAPTPRASTATATAAVAPVVPDAVAPSIAAAAPLEALLPPSAACLANSSGGARATSVHRWTDGAGIVHYSDQPPPSGARDARLLDVPGLPAVSVQASGYDVDLPTQLQQRAVADALGVQRVLHDALGVQSPSGLALHIVFVKAADAYARLIGDATLAASAGAYSTAQRTIYVRMQERDEGSFAVLRHEITHAIVHESIGNLPTPINEGLAEYFGRYRVAGLGGEVDIAADRRAMIAAAPSGDGSDALVDLLAREGAAFYALGTDPAARETRYLQSYALVALLMHGAEGRATLAAVLKAQRADPCRPLATERAFEAGYAGGLAALSDAWSRFMRDPPADVQSY